MSDPNSSPCVPPQQFSHSRQLLNQEIPQSQLARSNQLPYNIQQQQKISWKPPDSIRRNSFSSSDNKEVLKQKSPQQEQQYHQQQQQHFYNNFVRSEDIGANKSRFDSNYRMPAIQSDNLSGKHNNTTNNTNSSIANSCNNSYRQGNIFDSNNPINILRNSSLSTPFKQQGFCRKTGKQMAEEKTNSFFQGLNSSKKISRKNNNNNTSYKAKDKGGKFLGQRKKQNQNTFQQRNQNQEIQEKTPDNNQHHQQQQHQQVQQKPRENYSRDYIIDQYKKFKKLKQKLNKNMYCSPKITTRFLMQNKIKEQKEIAQAAQLNNQQQTADAASTTVKTPHFSMLDSLLANDERKRERQSQKITQLLEFNGCSDTESLKRISKQLYEKLAKKFTDNQHLREVLRQKQKILQELKEGNNQELDFDDSDEDESEFDFDLSISGNQIDSDIEDDEGELNELNQQLTVPYEENSNLGKISQQEQVTQEGVQKQDNQEWVSQQQQEKQIQQETQKQEKQPAEAEEGLNEEILNRFNSQQGSRNFLVYDEDDSGFQYEGENEYNQYGSANQLFNCEGEDQNQQQQQQFNQFTEYDNGFDYQRYIPNEQNEVYQQLEVNNEPQEIVDINLNQNNKNEAIPGENDDKNYQQNEDNNA